MSRRLMVDLDAHEKAVLARVAGGDEEQAAALARVVLGEFVRGLETDPQELASMLDRIPGAWERIQEGDAQIAAGRGIPLNEL